ncbi:MAG: sulfurtransferase-like selenium metabolism protein YedF [Deltaproteobacteria bacterium]|nr:sulfurtransferase-like selenium metabolism protein YedF [Deltaproteobacteria bacterium]
MKSIDCCGLACPAPVLQTKNAIENEKLNKLTIIVDNEAAKQNVARFLKSQNFDVSVQEDGTRFNITGNRTAVAIPVAPLIEKSETDLKKIMVMVTNNLIGHGDRELGYKLMISFLKTLKEMGNELWRLVFINNGVKLTITGSEALPILKELDERDLHILVCGTCLIHFNLLDKKQVGETTNMLDIVTAMQLADKVISI